MESVNGTTANAPLALLKMTLVEQIAAVSVFAAEARLTIKFVWPLAASEPLVTETDNHTEVFIRLQFTVLLLKLVRKKFCEPLANGPPTGPTAVKPLTGATDSGWKIWSANGMVCTMCEV